MANRPCASVLPPGRESSSQISAPAAGRPAASVTTPETAVPGASRTAPAPLPYIGTGCEAKSAWKTRTCAARSAGTRYEPSAAVTARTSTSPLVQATIAPATGPAGPLTTPRAVASGRSSRVSGGSPATAASGRNPLAAASSTAYGAAAMRKVPSSAVWVEASTGRARPAAWRAVASRGDSGAYARTVARAGSPFGSSTRPVTGAGDGTARPAATITAQSIGTPDR
jgi:hypothetical protein